MKKLLLVIGLCIAGTTAVFGQAKNMTPSTKAEQEVLRKQDEWIEALKHNDAAALERIFDPDFHIMESDDRLLNKEQEIAPIRSGAIKFEQLSAEEVKVFVHGDTAIATGIAVFRGTFEGKPFDGRGRFFDVYQKRKGKWRVIASRATPLPLNRES
jgi:ketosteroid isomerase-like protein